MGLLTLLGRFERAKVDAIVATRNTVGVVLAIAIAQAAELSGGPKIAVIMGAMFVSNADRSDPYRSRGGRMLTTTLLCTGASFLGMVSSHDPFLAALLAVVGAFAAGLLVVVDQVSADLGVLALVALVLYTAQPPAPGQVGVDTLYVLLGGTIQTLLSVAFWPSQRYRPEEIQLGQLFLTLSAMALREADVSQVPLGSEESTMAQFILTSIAGDSRPEGSRYRSLLSQAERIRLNLITLARLRARLQRESDDERDVHVLDAYLQGVSQFLDHLGRQMVAGKVGSQTPAGNGWQSFAPLVTPEENFLTATRRDVLFHMQTLDGQLRAVAELAHEVTPLGQSQVLQIEKARPWALRMGGTLATIRANLNFKSQGFRHALRMAVAVAVCEVILNYSGLVRPYWIPMTLVLVLKPEFASTMARFILRIGGTILGLALSTALYQLLPHNGTFVLALFLLFTFLLKWLGAANYGVLALCVSGQVVILLAIAGIPPQDVVGARCLDTALGGLIALLAYWLWPSQEKDLLADLLANLLDGYRGYFYQASQQRLGVSESAPGLLDRLRWTTRACRSRYGASLERYLLDPSVSQEQRSLLAGINASSNRFAHAAIALETGKHPMNEEQRLAFNKFVEGVLLLLEHLAGALREIRNPAHQDVPKLRSLYIDLDRAYGANPTANILGEMDRLTNSLSTLSEQIADLMPYLAGAASRTPHKVIS